MTDPCEEHFIEQPDGSREAKTPCGEYTIVEARIGELLARLRASADRAADSLAVELETCFQKFAEGE